MSEGSQPAFAVGTTIGPFEITGWVGAGGMGGVYRARDRRLDRDVAIKVIAGVLATDERRLRRLRIITSRDFTLLDLDTSTTRQLTRLGDHGALTTFDVTPDGKAIVFDRSRCSCDVVLIERPK